MAAYLLIGLGLILLHHFFFSYLNKKSIDSKIAELPSLLRDQNAVALIGTTIAHGVRATLSTAVGIAFAQIFWKTLQSRSYTIQQIDTLVRCGQSPFNPSAFRAVTASFFIFVVSCIASAMALVVIVVPGSLTIGTGPSPPAKPCTVPTVPDVMESRYETVDLLFEPLAEILTSNTNLPPFIDIECDSECSYNISFVGPAFGCIDVSSQTDFTDLLHPQLVDPMAPFLIWDETAFFEDIPHPNSVPIGASVLSQDLVKGVVQASNCTAYNATYEVKVMLEGEVTFLWVWNMTLHSVVKIDNTTNTFMSAYSRSAVDLLAGRIYAGPSGYVLPVEDGSSSSQIPHSAFFVTTPTGNHTWSDNITQVLTSYMQNVALSLLSGTINIGFSNFSENLLYVNTTCTLDIDTNAYLYNPTQLLLPYGLALVITLLAWVPGCLLIWRRGAKEQLLLSHILKVSLNEQLFRISGEVREKTQVQLEHGVPGKLLPASNNSSVGDVPYASEQNGESMELTNRCIVF